MLWLPSNLPLCLPCVYRREDFHQSSVDCSPFSKDVLGVHFRISLALSMATTDVGTSMGRPCFQSISSLALNKFSTAPMTSNKLLPRPLPMLNMRALL